MILDELASLRERITRSIDLHGDRLKKSEAATRYALIDPLLQTLGWDLSDLLQSVPEFVTGGRFADYALFTKSDSTNPIIVIEAKSLDSNLIEKEKSQLVSYCVNTGVKYGLLTNGRRWIIYDVFKPVRLDEKIEVEFSITDSQANVVMSALWLWRGNFEGAQLPKLPVQPAVTPVPPITAPQVASVSGWRLSNLEDDQHQIRPPFILRFSDGTQKSVKSWRGLSKGVFEWVVDGGYLANISMPLRAKGVFINDTPSSEKGTSFRGPMKRSTYYFNAHKNSKSLIKFSFGLLNYAQIDVSKIIILKD